MRKPLFIASLMGAIPALLLIIASFVSREDWEWRSALGVFIWCILPFAISGFIGATVFENNTRSRQIEQISKSEERIEENADDQKEPVKQIGEKNNLPETTNINKSQGSAEASIVGAVIGGIVFVVVALIACQLLYSLVCQNGCY